MGFNIYVESDPNYSIHFSMWEWDRLLDILLWSKKIYTLPELQDRLTASNMNETHAKAKGAGQELVDFDMKEWEKKVKVKLADRSIMHVGGSRDKSGRYIFNNMSLELDMPLDEKELKEVKDKLVRQAAASLSLFQSLEDKMFYNKSKLPGLYGIHTNEFDLSYDGCWQLYDFLLSLILPDDAPDIGRMLLGIGKKAVGKRHPSLSESFMDSICGELIDSDMLGKITRLLGILVNGIQNGGDSLVMIR